MPKRLLIHWKTTVGCAALLVGLLFGSAEVLHAQRSSVCNEIGRIMNMESRYYRKAAGCYINTPQGWRNVRALHYMDPFE